MKRVILIALALGLMSASTFAQTRRATGVTYSATINNCNDKEIVIAFSKKLTTDFLLPYRNSKHGLIQQLNKANGLQHFSVDGNDITLTRSDGVSGETAIANTVAAVERHFGWQTKPKRPAKVGNERCLSPAEIRALLDIITPPRRTTTSERLDRLEREKGPKRVPNGPLFRPGPLSNGPLWH